MARKLALAFVTCGYIRLSPHCAGNMGFHPRLYSALSAPRHSQSPRSTVMLLTIAAIFCINRMELPEKDPGYIVVDELAGICVTMVGQGLDLSNLLKGFILFRIFDILKPFPIRRLEGLPKGYGIVADDILAGIYANAALLLLGRLR